MLQRTDSLGPLCPGPAAVLAPLRSPKLLCQPCAYVQRAPFLTGKVPSTTGKWGRGHGTSGSSGGCPFFVGMEVSFPSVVFLGSSAPAGLLLLS